MSQEVAYILEFIRLLWNSQVNTIAFISYYYEWNRTRAVQYCHSYGNSQAVALIIHPKFTNMIFIEFILYSLEISLKIQIVFSWQVVENIQLYIYRKLLMCDNTTYFDIFPFIVRILAWTNIHDPLFNHNSLSWYTCSKTLKTKPIICIV